MLDLAGGATQARSYDVLKSGGRLVSTIQQHDEALAAAHGVKASMLYVKPDADRLHTVVKATGDQSVRIVLNRKVAFDEAWGRQTSERARGKIVVSLA